VRLVHRLTDRSTGKDRDVVVQLLRGGAPYVEREPNSPLPRHTRYIAGEDIEVAWPQVDAPLYDAYPGDTTRYDVEAITFSPTLYEKPVPEAAFEDLFRLEKFDRARRAHDQEYLRMKVLEDARAKWYMERKMQSPLERMVDERKRRASERVEALKKAGMSAKTRRIIEKQMRVAAGETPPSKTKHAKVMA
jgi:large subunit ribosomal protein L24